MTAATPLVGLVPGGSAPVIASTYSPDARTSSIPSFRWSGPLDRALGPWALGY